MYRLVGCAAAWLLASSAMGAPVAEDPDAKAAAVVARMTPAEKTVLTHGVMALPVFGPVPPEAVIGAGYIAGLPRLGVPPLKETDASLGVAWVSGLRKDGATALPSGMALGATWNPDLARSAGAMIGGEARAKGFNVMLAGGANLIRDPRNGRTFEYLSEDPLLTGAMAGAAIDGIQSNHIVSTVKHFALNDQETGRHFGDVKIGEAAARESDLLAFEIAIERGRPGAVMCAYNRVWGDYACDNRHLLVDVLERDWGFRGWVMSDWGAVPRLEAALHGLDQQSGQQIDPKVFFAEPLAKAVAADPAYAARVDDMNRRILRSMYAVGVDAAPPGGAIDFKADGQIALAAAREGIVLLRNQHDVLPLAAKAGTIAVIGGYADTGVLSGAGSSQVDGPGGPAASVPYGGEGPFAAILAEHYQRGAPLAAIKAKAGAARVIFRTGRYVSEAVEAARSADVVILFATQWLTEGLDAPDLGLPQGQDALIEAVAKANPHTIVVLETGGPVLMPWLDQTAAVLEAWYPGARGGEAIASVLFGETNPSGRLPVTFPAALSQLPRPELPGSKTIEPNFEGRGQPGQTLAIDYTLEGSDVGYRWFARKGETPAFPFGFGLSYTRFRHGPLMVSPGATPTARVSVTNTGARAGADVVQVYLTGAGRRRLAGFRKVDLAPGETREVGIALEPRVLADWTDAGWRLAAGRYAFAVGESAGSLDPPTEVTLPERVWRP